MRVRLLYFIGIFLGCKKLGKNRLLRFKALILLYSIGILSYRTAHTHISTLCKWNFSDVFSGLHQKFTDVVSIPPMHQQSVRPEYPALYVRNYSGVYAARDTSNSAEQFGPGASHIDLLIIVAAETHANTWIARGHAASQFASQIKTLHFKCRAACARNRTRPTVHPERAKNRVDPDENF